MHEEILKHMQNALTQLHDAKMLMQGQQAIAFDEKQARDFVFLFADIKYTMQSLQGFVENDKNALRRVWDERVKSK